LSGAPTALHRQRDWNASSARRRDVPPEPRPQPRSEGPDTNRVAQLALPSSLALAAFGAQAEGFAPSAGGPYTGPAAQVSDAAAGAQTASPQAATRLLPIEVRAITPAA
jgi:hypothetical protein